LQDFLKELLRSRDTETEHQQEGTAISPVSSQSVSEGEGAGISTIPRTDSDERRRATETISTSADPRNHMERTWSLKKGDIRDEGLETELSPSEMKE
jgi:hypothetical protein